MDAGLDDEELLDSEQLIIGPYEDVASHEYLDASYHHLGMDGILSLLNDLQEDFSTKQVNLNYNLPLDQLQSPAKVQEFLRLIGRHLRKNSRITAVDLAGNHLFYHRPHPVNDHKDYLKELLKQIQSTAISRIDLSDNFIVGRSGRELKGLINFLDQFAIKGKGEALGLRSSLLYSQGLSALIHGLGYYSKLTYLDISDNLGGLDAHGRSNNEGVMALANQLLLTRRLKVLRIARNHLNDMSIELLTNSIQSMPQMEWLDVSGNVFQHFACRSIRSCIMSHGLATDGYGGFKRLDVSSNRIGDIGLNHLCEAVERSETLTTLSLAHCRLGEEGAQQLLHALRRNATLVHLDVRSNRWDTPSLAAVSAEVIANRVIRDLRRDVMSMNTRDFTSPVYSAVARKLRFLDSSVLKALHGNPSFNKPDSPMQKALYILSPPTRSVLLAKVKEAPSASMAARLQASKYQERRISAAIVIQRYVWQWYQPIRQQRIIIKALREAEAKQQQQRGAGFNYDSIIAPTTLNNNKAQTSM